MDLTCPRFQKRVYGFWDGGSTFRVRVTATAPGAWTWRSGSTPADPGLNGENESFPAIAWTEEEIRAKPLRHVFLRSTVNHHALEPADGTPFLLSDSPSSLTAT